MTETRADLVRLNKALDGIVAMRNKKNDYQSSLHRAQHALLGCWTLLEDIDDARCLPVPLAARVTAMLNEVGVFLETEPFVQDPNQMPELPFDPSSNPEMVDHGVAPDIG